MFWSKEYTPEMIGCELSDEELQQFLNKNEIGLKIVDNSTRWAAFSQYYARQKGFDIIKATSFSYMVSLFMTGMGISASTEMYFKEEQIEYDLIDRLNEIKSDDTLEEKKVLKMFRYIYWTYRDHISDYEYATERLSFKLTPSEMETFQKIKGKNNKEKFKKLLGVNKMYTVQDNKNSKDLTRLGFPKELYTSPESCEIFLRHCERYHMKFLKGSYGTLIHKEFDKYFKTSKSNKIRDILTCKELNEEITLPLDHVNLFKSKIENDVYILTSSPYDSLNMNMFNQLKDYPYSIYVIHPNFLDYIAFVDNTPIGALRSPIQKINYAFTNASPEQMLNINKVLYDDLDLDNFVFKFLSKGD